MQGARLTPHSSGHRQTNKRLPKHAIRSCRPAPVHKTSEKTKAANMKAIIGLIIALILPAVLGSQEPDQSGQPERIQVRLSTERSQYRLGEIIHVRVEIKNVGDHPILVGRELSTIGNWPFSIWLRLVDSSGKYAQPVHGAYIDPPPRPDLSVRDGILRWWTTLDPGCFYGKEMD